MAAAAAQPRSDVMAKPSQKPSALRSVIAGAIAGGVEISITYPAEFAKTRSQLNRKLPMGQKLPWPPFGAQWYAGCTTLIIGNSAKAAIRFVSFEQYKRLLSPHPNSSQVSGPRSVLAGFLAGVTESLFAVTPTESIKTTLIDNRNNPSSQPRLRGFLDAVPHILRTRGPRGFFQGLAPTMARQSANSAVRFGSYNMLRQFAESSLIAPGETLGAAATFGIGGIAGAVTVAVTQPLDTIKTRMQSIEAKSVYGNSVRCAGMILRQEGLRTFWSGAGPRLVRLVLSGGIVFTLYEKCLEGMRAVDPEGRWL